jgi:hypothetical protein
MRELERLVSLLGLAAVATQVGCAANGDICAEQTYEPPPAPEPDASTPAVRSGRWLGPTTLELQFTAPLASEGQLDLLRFGVLGFGVNAYQGELECYVRTGYDWLGASGSYYNPAVSMGVDAVWIGPEDDTLLRLQIPMFEACPTPGTPGETLGSGVLLVYAGLSDAAGARLLDAQGSPLGDIGSDWAIGRIETCIESADDDVANCAVNGATQGQLSELISLVEIPCPGS